MTIEKFIDKWEIWWMDLPADQRGEKRNLMREDLKEFRKKSFPVDKRVMQKIAKIIDKEIADYEREIKIWNDCLEPEESTKPIQDRKNIIGILKALKLKIASNFSA